MGRTHKRELVIKTNKNKIKELKNDYPFVNLPRNTI